MNKAKRYVIYGRVQGVGFRYFTWREAEKLGLCGFVRNREDGSVEVIAQGSEAQLVQLKQWLQQGPRTARVERVLDYVHSPIQMDHFSVIRG